MPFLNRVYKEASPWHGSLNDGGRNETPEITFSLVGCKLLSALPKEFLETIVDGNVPLLKKTLKERRRHEPLARFMTKWDARVEKQPSIYQRALVHDKDKTSPTPNQLLEVTANLRVYGNGTNRAVQKKIDSLVGNYTKEELRYIGDPGYYANLMHSANTETDKKDYAEHMRKAKESRNSMRTRIQVFCDKAEQRLKALPSYKRSRPLANPWSYIGFAKDAFKRNDKQHNKHVSSSPLMMLVEATAMYTLNPPGLRAKHASPYRMDWSVVSYISDADEATPAEIIMAVISESYWDSGNGLAVEPSGKSNDVKFVTKDQWDQFATWTMQNTPFHENTREQNALTVQKRQLRILDRGYRTVMKKFAQQGYQAAAEEVERQNLIRELCILTAFHENLEHISRLLEPLEKKTSSGSPRLNVSSEESAEGEDEDTAMKDADDADDEGEPDDDDEKLYG
ncbi:hypothetical protein UCRNP2_2375 [Neofusicoccum parvum UCRNP2]|uniref:Uncharacterized protein n=1 Tax=Botryosphaeria parva (strain UCR-NP2) TaxID=1287680 RepID=R1ESS3_BOTPV|nr:hypothetical protein UCRNP2_2375 [Neofusicoccum parvum UCRNP2]